MLRVRDDGLGLAKDFDLQATRTRLLQLALWPDRRASGQSRALATALLP